MTLNVVSEWARARVASGEEPPWTFHKLKQLAALTEEFAEGFESSVQYTPGLETDESAPATQAVQASENIISLERFRAAEPAAFVNLPA